MVIVEAFWTLAMYSTRVIIVVFLLRVLCVISRTGWSVRSISIRKLVYSFMEVYSPSE